MIPYNTSIYGENVVDYISGSDTEKIGEFLDTSLFGYFNNGGALYDPDHMTTIEDSVYLWKINPSSAAGTNAAVCTDNSVLYHAETVENDVDTVYLGMVLQSTSQFVANPQVRLAYNDTFLAGSYYPTSHLFVNINRLKFCACPRALIYNPTADDYTSIEMSQITTYLANPSNANALIYGLSLYLFHGDTTRTTDGTYLPGGAFARPVPDILTDRPIPDNATCLKALLHYDYFDSYHADWIDTETYNPFTIATQKNWYSSDSSGYNDFHIGQHLRLTIGDIKNGKQWVSNSYPNITGFFVKYTDRVQEYDDVIYKWEVKCYNIDLGRHLEEGENLYSLGNSNRCELYTALVIVDDKGDSANAVKNALLHEAANFGFWFAENETKAKTAVLGSTSDGNGIYLPEFVDRTTTGLYFTGADIADVPYADAENVSDLPEGGGGDDDEIGENNTIINTGTIGSGATYYALTDSEMNELSTWLNTTYEPTDEDTFIQDFKGTDPANYITSVMFYPFDIPLAAGADLPIVVGKLTAGSATGRLLYYTYGDLYSYGSYTVPKYGNWLDYLCKTTVFIPFCGSVELDPILWAGHTLTVKMAIDWPTGVCTAFIYRDNGMIDSISGTIGVPLPLSAVANGSYQVSITNLLASHKAAHRGVVTGALGVAGGVGATIGGAIAGSPKLAIGGLISTLSSTAGMDSAADKMDNIDYNIDHTQPRVTEVSGGSPFINCGTDYRVKILRTEPMMMTGYNAAVYGHTIGFADCQNVENLSDISGFVQCTNIDTTGLGVPADLIRLLNIACQEGLIV